MSASDVSVSIVEIDTEFHALFAALVMSASAATDTVDFTK